MAGEMEILFSLAGRIYVLLRRESNRMIDVEWLIENADYAREVLRLIRATEHPELLALAERVAALPPLLMASAVVGPVEKNLFAETKYVMRLR